MSLKGVDIQRGVVGASVLGNNDAICGLLATGVAVAANEATGLLGLTLGKTVKITSPKEAAGYGIDADYDTDNSLSVYRHVSEFFRIAGEGSELYLMLYPKETTYDGAFGATYAKQMLADADGKIRVLAVANTPTVDTLTYEADGTIIDLVQSAQTFAQWAYDTFKPCQVLLEGRNFDAATALAAADLRNLEVEGQVLHAIKVSVCIGQDWTYADELDAVRKKMADVGTLLGSCAKRSVQENVGQVNDGSIEAFGYFATAGLSDHVSIAQWDTDLEDLNGKGYVFVTNYTGIAGKYWNDDATCTPIVEDTKGNLNENSISLGRVHDKAVRELRAALLPLVKSSQPIDAKTGKMPQALVSYFESVGDGVFGAMAARGEISGGKAKVDANSDLLVLPRELKVSFSVVPVGQVGVITGFINLKTSL